MSPVTRYSSNKCKSPAQRCQIGSLLLYGTQVSSVRLLFNVTQATWLSLLLNVARSEVSYYTLPKSQVYVSWSSLSPAHIYVPELLFKYTVFARVICALFFYLAAKKSGCIKYADFFCGGLDVGFILV